MIDGKGGGTGKYSQRWASWGRRTVLVSHMPEESFSVRIVFKESEETSIPILKVSETEAELLWVALSQMAEDLKWDAKMPCDKSESP